VYGHITQRSSIPYQPSPVEFDYISLCISITARMPSIINTVSASQANARQNKLIIIIKHLVVYRAVNNTLQKYWQYQYQYCYSKVLAIFLEILFFLSIGNTNTFTNTFLSRIFSGISFKWIKLQVTFYFVQDKLIINFSKKINQCFSC